MNTAKSLINIFLYGGPPHMDTFALKPKAPREYRPEPNCSSDRLKLVFPLGERKITKPQLSAHCRSGVPRSTGQSRMSTMPSLAT
jgi:hypothetical protein